ncbi:Zn-ribbon domain-containing OB-fold protein [Sphingobium sp. YC-XJ3]|uniref:Zn-ribbon domain-containing OB-fold protein n=1 Tax=Sphingobium sp. YC-XJ3 TaxID=3024245 RepID=UPI002360320F|nr:OB-fold domain-containing protein [Sphingobium sp. YC-XJ3]WDA39377.1 OB-fold domain-containing protein [Sphingobium sp. YC-XJ3]WDA39462.1 OB-fold domain-containing protein [Sphingobium sp. YC-XJ3]
MFERDALVHSYTIQRFAPPQPNALPSPYAPRPVAWVDLANGGPRVLSTVACDPDEIHIDMNVRLNCVVGWTDPDGTEVVSFTFAPFVKGQMHA